MHGDIILCDDYLELRRPGVVFFSPLLTKFIWAMHVSFPCLLFVLSREYGEHAVDHTTPA